MTASVSFIHQAPGHFNLNFMNIGFKGKYAQLLNNKVTVTNVYCSHLTDDIFSTGTTKPTVKPTSKSKKSQPAQDPISTAETGHNIFDDPLNAFGGN